MSTRVRPYPQPPHPPSTHLFVVLEEPPDLCEAVRGQLGDVGEVAELGVVGVDGDDLGWFGWGEGL
jgi:hypothetical protein